MRCAVDGCISDIKNRRGWCGAHYERWRTTGSVQAHVAVFSHGPEWKRFWRHVDASGDCWEWTGSTTWQGYGQFNRGDRNEGAHRVAWRLLIGPIPGGLVTDHRCRNTSCVNPDHLELVTPAENSRRSPLGGVVAMNAAKTHCKQGHPFKGDNLYMRPNGGRRCRTCDSERHQRNYQRKT